jgi:hypothetical protein
MLRKPGDTETSPSTDGDVVVRDEEGQNIINDVETGIVDPTNSVHANSPFIVDEDESEYTHVLIPLPGHRAIPNRLGRVLEDCVVDTDGKTKRSSLSLRMFIRTSKVGPDNSNARKGQGERGISYTKDEVQEVNDTDNDPVTEDRAVPIHCAVCLTKYEVSNRVCWSSNSECSHVFHEDCMLHWLVVLGRSQGKLLEFHKSCPCCRKDFISFLAEENA